MRKKVSSLWLVPMLLLLVGSVAIASGVIRLSAMTDAISTGVIPEDAEGLFYYVEHSLISTLHLIPGMIIMLLAPLQFVPGVRNRWPSLHRWSGRLLVFSGILVAVSAITMASIFPVIVNHVSTAANITFSITFIAALCIALHAIFHRDIARHRAWMIRAYAIALTPAIMRIFFSGLYLILGEEFMGYLPVLIWSTFLFDIAMAELILYLGRYRKRSLLPSLA
ncbi:MAG: DUF2306 domain-containing protein [Thiohalomonadales bacterium]